MSAGLLYNTGLWKALAFIFAIRVAVYDDYDMTIL